MPYYPFPYVEGDKFKAAGADPIPVYRPLLGTWMNRRGLRWNVRALVDTGAPFTLFDRTAGIALGVDFDDPHARREQHQLGGATHLAQYADVTLAIPPFAGLTWTAEIGFIMTEWEMPFGGLLGQEGFLDHWAVSFDYPNSFVIETKAAFEDRLAAFRDDQVAELWQWQELGWRGPPPS